MWLTLPLCLEVVNIRIEVFVLAGGLYFKEFDNFSGFQLAMFGAGVSVTVFGIVLLTMLRARTNSQEQAAKAKEEQEVCCMCCVHEVCCMCYALCVLDCFLNMCCVSHRVLRVSLCICVSQAADKKAADVEAGISPGAGSPGASPGIAGIQSRTKVEATPR